MRLTGLTQKEGVGGDGGGGALNPLTLASSFFRGISFRPRDKCQRTALGRPFDWVSCEL